MWGGGDKLRGDEGRFYGFDYANKGIGDDVKGKPRLCRSAASLQLVMTYLQGECCGFLVESNILVGSSVEFGEISEAVEKALKNLKNVFGDP